MKYVISYYEKAIESHMCIDFDGSADDLWHHYYDDLDINLTNIHTYDDFRKDMKAKLRRATAIKMAIKRLGGDLDIVEFGIEVYPFEGSRKFFQTKKLSDILDSFSDYHEILAIKTLDDLKNIQNDYYEDAFIHFLGTIDEYRKYDAEQRRKELESFASDFARSHNIQSNSLDFIAAVEDEIHRIELDKEGWNNPEVRMEEWAACRYAGVGSDVYFDDLNFENGRFDTKLNKLNGILTWLSEQCPLLWAQYQEHKA